MRKLVVLLILAAVLLAAPAWAVRPNLDGDPNGTDMLLWHLDEPTNPVQWTDSTNHWIPLPGTGNATSVPGLFADPFMGGLGAVTNFPTNGFC